MRTLKMEIGHDDDSSNPIIYSNDYNTEGDPIRFFLLKNLLLSEIICKFAVEMMA